MLLYCETCGNEYCDQIEGRDATYCENCDNPLLLTLNEEIIDLKKRYMELEGLFYKLEERVEKMRGINNLY